MSPREQAITQIQKDWKENPRWKGVRRGYDAVDVVKLRGSVKIEHTLAKLGAEKLTAGPAAPVPVPLNVTACGLPLALSVKLNVALRLPVADGVNFTMTEQVLPGATAVFAQPLVVMAKSPALVPPIATVVRVRLAVPVLVTVSVMAELVVLTA